VGISLYVLHTADDLRLLTRQWQKVKKQTKKQTLLRICDLRMQACERKDDALGVDSHRGERRATANRC
jgi:hypothetical protein